MTNYDFNRSTGEMTIDSLTVIDNVVIGGVLTVGSLIAKEACRVATTADIGATYNNVGGNKANGEFTSAPTSIDGVTLNNNDRILVKNQTNADENGIWYAVNAAGGVWYRAIDADADSEVRGGAFVTVAEGTVNASTMWIVTSTNPHTVGTASGTAITWAKLNEQMVQEDHLVTAGEVTNGYFDLSIKPQRANSVMAFVDCGIRQKNKQATGASGTPDFDVIGQQLHINNNGAATGLSGDIEAGDTINVVYMI